MRYGYSKHVTADRVEDNTPNREGTVMVYFAWKELCHYGGSSEIFMEKEVISTQIQWMPNYFDSSQIPR